jgi:hypothetical protein
VAFGTGSLFAAAVEKGLRSERYPYFYQRALTANLIFQLLLVVWLPVYLLIAHFGFQTSHMWWTGTSITDYPWLLPVFLVTYFSANIAGFHVGARLVTSGRRRAPWVLFAGGFVFFGAWMAVQPYRTLTWAPMPSGKPAPPAGSGRTSASSACSWAPWWSSSWRSTSSTGGWNGRRVRGSRFRGSRVPGSVRGPSSVRFRGSGFRPTTIVRHRITKRELNHEPGTEPRTRNRTMNPAPQKRFSEQAQAIQAV